MSDKPKDDDWGMTMPHMRLEKDESADGFSDGFAPNARSANQSPADEWGMTQQNFNLPQNHSSPADFDRTTPNINIPRDAWQDSPQSSSSPPSSPDDWGMTPPNFGGPSRQKTDDGWGATAPNINVPQGNKADDWEMGAPNPNNVAPANKADDWGTGALGRNVSPENKADDWGMSSPNINIPSVPNANAPRPGDSRDDWSMPAPVFRISEGEKVDNLPKRTPNFDEEPIGFDKTAPNFNFSENSPPGMYGAPSAANAGLPPPSVAAPLPAAPAVQEISTTKSGGSKMIYALAGLIGVLFLGIVALAGVYFLYLDKPEATSVAETPKEEPKDNAALSAPASAPVAAPTAEIATPKEIEYKGAMLLVAAGEFTMGSDAGEDEAKPAHAVTLPAFYIDKTEVTNAEYKKFCDATGKSYPPDPHLEKNYFTNRPNAPVVGVSFADAKAYADWAGKRLPTEAEWEKAASWDETAKTKRAFPWGNDFQKSNAAFQIASISDVGKFSGGASPSGAQDMAGNVLEWVDAYFQPYAGNTAANPEFGEKNRVVRGGHFGSKTNDSLKTTKRIYVAPDIASGEDDEKLVAAIIGFRCAVSADDSELKEVLNAQSK